LIGNSINMKKTQGLYNPRNIEELKNTLLDFNQLIDDFSIYKIESKSTLSFPESVFNKLLNRTRINLEGIICLLDTYKIQPFLFHSMSHIFRALLVDFLNFLYLITFIEIDEEDFISFRNEYEFFNRDYYKAMLDLFDFEKEIPKECPLFEKIGNKSHEREIGLRSTKNHFSYLHKDHDIEKRLKNSTELRSTSNPNLFFSKEEFMFPGNKILSEKYKYKRILKSPLKQFVDVYMYYKYFSQQYHFSHQSNDLADEKDDNFLHIIWSINRIFNMVQSQFMFLDGKDSKFLNPLSLVEKKLENCLENK